MNMFRFWKKQKVIIVGAGLAGLSAAYTLKKKGLSVVVLEARDRIGGRVDTRIVGDEGLIIEGGAEWVGKNHERVLDYCRIFGLKLTNHRLKPHLLLHNRHYHPGKWKFSQNYHNKLKKILNALPEVFMNNLAQAKPLDWWHYLVLNHFHKRDIELEDILESSTYGESIRQLPAHDVLEDLKNEVLELEDYYHIDGGSSRFAECFTKQISHDLLLNTQVSKISQTDKSVSVTTTDGIRFVGDKLIVALPTHALLEIKWDPDLSEEKKEANKSIKYANITKYSILFSRRFWQEDSFEVITDDLTHAIYHSTQSQHGHKGILTAYIVGEAAQKFNTFSKKEKLHHVCKILSRLFGKVDDLVEEVFEFDWSKDPYTKGAYSVYLDNQFESLKASLESPFINTYFAGEHLAKDFQFQGYMEGAIRSGERAAREILNTR